MRQLNDKVRWGLYRIYLSGHTDINSFGVKSFDEVLAIASDENNKNMKDIAAKLGYASDKSYESFKNALIKSYDSYLKDIKDNRVLNIAPGSNYPVMKAIYKLQANRPVQISMGSFDSEAEVQNLLRSTTTFKSNFDANIDLQNDNSLENQLYVVPSDLKDNSFHDEFASADEIQDENGIVVSLFRRSVQAQVDFENSRGKDASVEIEQNKRNRFYKALLKDTGFVKNSESEIDRSANVASSQTITSTSNPAPTQKTVSVSSAVVSQAPSAAVSQVSEAVSSSNAELNNGSNEIIKDVDSIGLSTTSISTEADSTKLTHHEIVKLAIAEKLSPYMTSKEMIEIQTSIGDYNYSDADLYRSEQILKYLWDKGLNFDVKLDDFGLGDKSIEAVIKGPSKVKIRILDDIESSQFIGRISKNGSLYYYNSKALTSNKVTPSDDFALLNVALGDISVATTVLRGGKLTQSVQGVYNKEDMKLDSVKMKPAYKDKLAAMSEDERAKYLASKGLKFTVKDFFPMQKFLQDNSSMPENEAAELYLRNLINSAREFYEESHEDGVDEPVDDVIGDYDNGFNPIQINSVLSDNGVNNAIYKLTESVMKSGYDIDKLFGSDFALANFKSKLISFNNDSYVSLSDEIVDGVLPSEFQYDIMSFVKQQLVEQGIGSNGYSSNKGRDISIKMDDQGIIKWSGFHKQWNQKAYKYNYIPVEGQIGQIFEPDEHGIVPVRLGNDVLDYDFVPGFRGYYQYDDISKSANERLRLMGYDQVMRNSIKDAISQQALRPMKITSTKDKDMYQYDSNISNVLDNTTLNNLYHGSVYGQRLEPGWFETSGHSLELKEDIVATLSKRVRFDNKLGELATTFSSTQSQYASVDKLMVSALVDHRNLRILDDSTDGIFDKTMTATGKNQGIVRYLSMGAMVSPDGSVVPYSGKPSEKMLSDYYNRMNNFEHSNPKEPDFSKAPILMNNLFTNESHDAWDRQQMAANQIMDSLGVAENVNLALMPFGGWTYDDGTIVSSNFANNNMVKGKNGEMRPLRIGDKISDFSGNKATISMVIDVDMTPEEASAQNLKREYDIFKSNDLDVVMSPYSVLTRLNTSVTRNMVNNDSHDVIDSSLDGDDQVIGKAGKANMIITNMLADEKTHVYDEDAVNAGQGRKFSSQLTWAVTQLGAKGVLHEAFGNNIKPWKDFREYMIVTGHDMTANGELHVGYEPHEGEVRNVFKVDSNKDVSEFLNTISEKGGFLKLPFELRLDTGQMTDEMPVLSAGLRRKMEFLDDTTQDHDYTVQYTSMYSDLLQYSEVDDSLDAKEKAKIQAANQKIQDKVQNTYNQLTNQIIKDKLGGRNGEFVKHSIIRDNLMTRRLSNSATALITPDPRLDIDTVRVSKELYDTLDLKNKDDRIMIFRDPILHGGSVRGVKVVMDETGTVSGMQVNPVIMKSFDGDFDGDSLGAWAPRSRAAQKDLKTVLAIENNLKDPISNPDNPDIYLNTSMDVTSGAANGQLVSLNDDETYGKAVKRQLSEYVNSLPNDEAVKAINSFLKKAFDSSYGSCGVDISSREAVLKSLGDIVETGAKGKPTSVKEFADYYDNNVSREMENSIQEASGIKTDETGIAGSNSQRLLALMRDINPEAALELTYVISQGTLQIKHDAEKAKVVDRALNEKLAPMFAGRSFNNNNNKNLSKAEFKKEIANVYTNDLGVGYRQDHLDAVADVLSDGSGMIKSVSELMLTKASPLDQLAYTGGYKTLQRLSLKVGNSKYGRSVAEGENASMQVPDSIKDVSDNKALVRKDTQNVELISSIRDAIDESVAPLIVGNSNEKPVINNINVQSVEKNQVERDISQLSDFEKSLAQSYASNDTSVSNVQGSRKKADADFDLEI